eukprot:scaffold18156_cov74-Phaeocystis_antarctica.AAC.2
MCCVLGVRGVTIKPATYTREAPHKSHPGEPDASQRETSTRVHCSPAVLVFPLRPPRALVASTLNAPSRVSVTSNEGRCACDELGRVAWAGAARGVGPKGRRAAARSGTLRLRGGCASVRLDWSLSISMPLWNGNPVRMR